MTSPATHNPACPKCGGPCWDQKNGLFPWKPGTPIFKCKDKECSTNGGVIWEPKGGAAPVATGRSGVPKPYNTPKALPGEFDGYEQEETAELNARTGNGSAPAPQSRGSIVAHQYEATLNWVLANVVPKLTEADIPVDGAAINSICATILIQASKAA